MKTAELTGKALDYAVALCDGYRLTTDGISHLLEKGKELRFLGPSSSCLSYSPSTEWAQGGPIIERERITVAWLTRAIWWAGIGDLDDEEVIGHDGPTPLIAAMRCYVASKLGEEVDIPKEVLHLQR